ncbi:hypothetical protein ACFQ21_07740 [Ohtaekwangia kribbensis]|uniref:Uncharacterized protein n=1 Tax=Ohtaekwangia kribbensis TaxID=688913 RepID=A0ABW3JZC7_9BACT
MRPFVSFRKTTLKDYSPYFNTATAAPAVSNNNHPANNNIYAGIDITADHKFTPKAYGGAVTNTLNVNYCCRHGWLTRL